MMTAIDVLIVTALPIEHDAARAAFADVGVELTPRDASSALPYLAGTMPTPAGPLSVGLARPTRMGQTATGPTAGGLIERLSPLCLAMSGVCAGNPSEVALGDVIVAECAYTYDEGKRTADGFEGDHRQVPLADKWLRVAQELTPAGLPSHRLPDDDDSRLWLLERLNADANPKKHPACERYLGDGKWARMVTALESEGMVKRKGRDFAITRKGRAAVEAAQAYRMDSPTALPFAIRIGPMASGNVVVKDGLTWDMLQALGVRTVMGLEMEAAVVAQAALRLSIPHWVVVKGVMDHADPKKEDLIKPFAARASADVLIRLLQSVPFDRESSAVKGQAVHASTSPFVNSVGDVSGKNISIVQVFGRS